MGRGYIIPYLGRGRRESSMTKLGFSSMNFKKKLTRGTEDTARLMI